MSARQTGEGPQRATITALPQQPSPPRLRVHHHHSPTTQKQPTARSGMACAVKNGQPLRPTEDGGRGKERGQRQTPVGRPEATTGRGCPSSRSQAAPATHSTSRDSCRHDKLCPTETERRGPAAGREGRVGEGGRGWANTCSVPARRRTPMRMAAVTNRCRLGSRGRGGGGGPRRAGSAASHVERAAAAG